jgi:hypothetical protein
MTSVRVLPLPYDADTSHHGPPKVQSAYLGYIRKPLSYIPILGSFLTCHPIAKEDITPYTYNHHGRSSPPTNVTESRPPPSYYLNPWPSWQSFTFNDAYTSYQKGAIIKSAPTADEEEEMERHGRLVKVLKPDFSRRTGHGGRPVTGAGGARVCWLGHASVFVQIPWSGEAGRRDGTDSGEREGMCGIMFDPIFSKRWVWWLFCDLSSELMR